ncbi:MAG: pyruvate kinase [Bacteroidota bacterium]|nr:pyruvate kinase [Bacteroidota bacterium]MEC7616759.1 pyruvate kinase [Bacteroidota bacterium]MEC8211745.1 pyruvate kinase [Bacteroidota bacterium]MEC8637427.1 pyruvate kinase [Bacteroidota bacterium]
MKEIKKTKIVATLGPSSSDRETIKDMMVAGVNIFRINFSHADFEAAKQRIELIRELNKELGFNVGVLADLQGPKLRVGKMKDDVVVEKGARIVFTTKKIEEGTNALVYMNYQSFPKDVKVGEQILLDDGKLIFEVASTDGQSEVVASVVQGGPLNSNKGVNLPNTEVSLPALTEKDVKDAMFAIEQQVDWFALSFVRNKEDLLALKKLIKKYSSFDIPIISKIEKPQALENIDEIIDHSNGLMVARGDLGVEVPAEGVPLIQKNLVLKAKAARIPVIIATQMMESMIEGLTPSRAEVNDVANSVIDGADAVMLSGETSIGKYPVEVIQTMRKIVVNVENSPLILKHSQAPQNKNDRFITKSTCYHAALMATEIEAKAICTLTNSGYTAYQISAWRPDSSILVFTSNRRILTQLNLLWGVKCHYYDRFVSTDETVMDVNLIAKEKGYVKTGDTLVNLLAMPVANKGMVNTLRVSIVKD